MIVFAIVIACWLGSGVLNAGMMGGWLYYELYPQYKILGTPDEQWERDGSDGSMWLIAFMAGPLGLIVIPFICGVRLKY